MHRDVVCVHVVPRHVEELVLVLPAKRLVLELFGFSGWWGRVSDLGDEVCRRSFCETVDKDAYEWYLNEYVEAQTKAEEYTSTVFEPQLLLIFVVAYTCEVWFELCRR